MMLASVIRFFCALCFIATASHALSLTKPGCQEKCGNVTIPYPFGIGAKCSANSSFIVICQNTAIPPRPLLSSINMEILNISLYGAVLVNLPLWPTSCFDGMITEYVSISLKGGPFFISAYYNSLVVMGCKNSVWLRTNATTVGGCMAICDDASSKHITCNGVNCCQISIPTRLQELQYTYQSIGATSSRLCGYIFPADKNWLQNEGYRRYKGLVSDLSNPFDRDFGFAPLVLEWELGTGTNFSNSICHCPHDVRLRPAYQYDYSGDVIYPARYPDVFCGDNPEDRRCQSLLDNYAKVYRYTFYHSVHDYVSTNRYCSCISGYEGNPYILKGCTDINEWRNARLNDCSGYSKTCIYKGGSFFSGCDYKQHYLKFTIAAFTIIVSVVGVLIWLNKVWFMKGNGGILSEKIMQFSPEEVSKATDGYNASRILGSGGEGVVYRGILEDGRNVAVKKLEKFNEQGDHMQDFIKEVINVSKINHRNVVKLLGYCQETGALHLVYEYMSNGTLSSHIHPTGDEVPHLSWDIRVRIAQQAGGALAYLHSAASVSIYHRDIKSTNILLDEEYCAKISDFGISRSISTNDTHVTTRVIGTHGYLDPEYFQSNRLTDKSDVYSFGVVLVELLTGEKAISDVRGEERRNLAMHFSQSMEEGRLFDILDARVLTEGREEEIEAMAEIARKCLHRSGKDRPTMKVVACQLQGIQAVPPKKKKTGFRKKWQKLKSLISTVWTSKTTAIYYEQLYMAPVLKKAQCLLRPMDETIVQDTPNQGNNGASYVSKDDSRNSNTHISPSDGSDHKETLNSDNARNDRGTGKNMRKTKKRKAK